MCKHCNSNEENGQKDWMKDLEDLKDVKGFKSIYKEVGTKPYEDLSNKKFGKLTAIKPVGRNKRGRLLWLCECECSGRTIVIARDLVRLHSTSCGCAFRKSGKEIKIGQHFGLLTVVENLGIINGKTHWRCVCDCHGKNGHKGEVITTTSNLNAGIKSCGCLKPKSPISKVKDLTGEQFENWLILSRAEDRIRFNGKRLAQWNCKCTECGREEVISGESLRDYPKKCECSRKIKVLPKSIEGNTYNFWTVIKDEGEGKVLARCECGTERWVSRHNLLENKSMSCGCQRKGKIKEDLTGRVFNYLTVLEELGEDKVRVKCKCGTEKIVSKKGMKYGSVKSCGCLSRTASARRMENLEGKVFTRWTVIKDEGGKKVLCKCSCGTERWVSRGNLRGKVSTSCGCLRKEEFHERFLKVQVGQVYGRLTITKLVGRNKNKKLVWEAKCSCGNTITVSSDLILKKHTRSCGCLKREQTIERCTKPMIGKVFGRLTVLEKAYTKKGKGAYYKCLCSCGNTAIIQGAMLRSGNSRSCGCLLKESQREFEDLSGRRFGKLVVLRRVPNKGEGHGHDVRFECKCDCGGITETSRYALISGETMSCGCINSKGEFKVANILESNNIEFKKQKTYKDLKSDSKYSIYKFDFYIPDGNYLIEYDGEQHFMYSNKGWNTKQHYDKVCERDKIKNDYCIKNNIPLIRIPYTHYEDLCIEDLRLETTKFRIN